MDRFKNIIFYRIKQYLPVLAHFLPTACSKSRNENSGRQNKTYDFLLYPVLYRPQYALNPAAGKLIICGNK